MATCTPPLSPLLLLILQTPVSSTPQNTHPALQGTLEAAFQEKQEGPSRCHSDANILETDKKKSSLLSNHSIVKVTSPTACAVNFLIPHS